jgi:hypothetical protein
MVERRGSVYNMDREKKAGRGFNSPTGRYIIREKGNLAEVDELLNRWNGDLCVLYFILCGSAIVGAT